VFCIPLCTSHCFNKATLNASKFVTKNFNILVSELSQAVVDAGAVPLLVLCIQEPEMSLKRIAASALSDICKHSPEVSYTDPIISAVPQAMSGFEAAPDISLSRTCTSLSLPI